MKIVAKTNIQEKSDEFLVQIEDEQYDTFTPEVRTQYGELSGDERTVVEWTAHIFADWLDNLTIERIEGKNE